VINYNLGWGDETSLIPKVEGTEYDCYTKCGGVPKCLKMPVISTTSFLSTPISPFQCCDPTTSKDV